jgi:DNA-binding beta-propeller fold protein YncE
LWATDFFGGSRTAVRIDPATAKTTLTIQVGAMPIAVTFGFDSGWVANGADATVTRFDPHTGQVVATIKVPGGDPAGILATAHGVWVACYADGYVYRIDPQRNTVVAATRIGEAAQDIAFADGLLWVTDSAKGRVVALRPTG